jgi:hypothetical protein
MTLPSHPPQLDHSNYTWRRVQIMKLLVMQLSPFPFSQILVVTFCHKNIQISHLKKKKRDLRFFTAINILVMDFWNAVPCSLAESDNVLWFMSS